MSTSNPKVFISYSHDSKEHKEWVKKLATDLRSHGVDVILDQFQARIGGDLRFFMENGLSESELVLCVCSKDYVLKANSGKGGASYETTIISSELIEDSNVDYFIPIIRNNPEKNKVPTCFCNKQYIDFSKDEEYYDKYSDLLRRIYDEDQKLIPPLGENPFSNDLANKIDSKTNIDKAKYHSIKNTDTIVFDMSNNNGVFIVGTGEYEFDTKWSSASNDVVYAYNSPGYKSGCYEFPDYDEIIEFDFSSWNRRVEKDEVIIFKNTFGKFLAVKVISATSKSHGKTKDEVQFKYKIYKEH